MKYLLLFDKNSKSQGLTLFSDDIDFDKEIKNLKNNYQIISENELIQLVGENFLEKSSFLYSENGQLFFNEKAYLKSSSLNSENKPYPSDGQTYTWNEEEQSWQLVEEELEQ